MFESKTLQKHQEHGQKNRSKPIEANIKSHDDYIWTIYLEINVFCSIFFCWWLPCAHGTCFCFHHFIHLIFSSIGKLLTCFLCNDRITIISEERDFALFSYFKAAIMFRFQIKTNAMFIVRSVWNFPQHKTNLPFEQLTSISKLLICFSFSVFHCSFIAVAVDVGLIVNADDKCTYQTS